MRTRTLGKSGIEASVVGLGTWAIGGWMWGGTNEADSIRAIQAALDAGITLIDTAPIYGFGVSEELVGKAIKGRREQVVLATKCGLVWDREGGDYYFDSDDEHPRQGGGYTVYKYLAPESIRQEVEQSLKRLQTETIDLYQTHWQESQTPREETMAALLALKHEGKIRAIGVSNIEPEQLREYESVGAVDAVQEKYSMLDRGQEQKLLPWCRKQSIAFLAYSPIAQGLLTGKLGPERIFAEGDLRAQRERFSVENRRRIQQMLDAYRSVTDAHGVTPAQLAIAWALHQPGCTHALVGARNPAQAIENAAAGELLLADEELALIGAAIDDYAGSFS